jgi:hypothetical protein
MEKTYKLIRIDDEYYLISNKVATLNEYAIRHDKRIAICNKSAAHYDWLYDMHSILATTNKSLNVCFALERKLINQKTPHNTDKLILLKRNRPVLFEIHHNEIVRDRNIIISTKNENLATKIVNSYNQYNTDIIFDCTIEYEKVYHPRIIKSNIKKDFIWKPKTITKNSKYINIIRIE